MSRDNNQNNKQSDLDVSNKELLINNLNRLSQQVTISDINDILNQKNISDPQDYDLDANNNSNINSNNDSNNNDNSKINYDYNNNSNNYNNNNKSDNEEEKEALESNNSSLDDNISEEYTVSTPISPFLPPIVTENILNLNLDGKYNHHHNNNNTINLNSNNIINNISIDNGNNINNINNSNNSNNINNSTINNNRFFNINNRLVDKTTIINFNVGGTLFSSSIRTIKLYPDSLLWKIVELQIDLVLNDEVIFIDRSPLYFPIILDFIRTGSYIPDSSTNSKGLLLEAGFYRLEKLSELVQEESELTRADIIRIINSSYDYPRLRGLWLMKVNFSGLDLSSTTFEYSNLSFSIFNSTSLRQVNMRGTKLNKSYFKNCDIKGSDLSKSIITNATFISNFALQLSANGVNFSGSNLSKTRFSGSDLSQSNFNGADLTDCNLSDCNLSNCDFRGCIFSENTLFNNSNIKSSLFDDNVSPSLFHNINNHNNGGTQKNKTWNKLKNKIKK
ncbi:hypothetical protein DICPUDRAFT_75567 [Dictyostelium purpureum]|uniref:BTB domain-containing protein n=1 Tax=Dictyostelium purpureum TaxID=5786 RepID=F0ZB13_DICPU|nr:uncharacterized protein DICPUDRAFT_75567 [Dictyostelium purpureum]EGC38813.1 hypothetical protein DICPUDRAFT_75567 [Dictyostelium purpureum]|eukprot:XP_003284607.1 hypothetical protein DICPUDRAFT_75567 [Dictyostelium purpureum]